MRRILAVELDRRSVRASVVESGLLVARHVKSDSGVIPDSDDGGKSFVAETLARWKKEFDPRGIVIGLPLEYFVTCTVEMPPLRRSQVRSALAFELERHLPMPVDEYVYDFIDASEGKKGTAFVFAARKEVVAMLVQAARDAGLDVLSVRSSTLAALRGMMEAAGQRLVSGLFVNITDTSYEVIGVSESTPRLFKRFSKATDILNEVAKLTASCPGGLFFTGNVDLPMIENVQGRKFQIAVADILAFSEVRRSRLNLNFLPSEYQRQKKDLYPYALGGLAAGTVGLFFLTGLVAYSKDVRTLGRIEDRIAAIKKQASGVLETQKKLDLVRNDRQVLLDFRQSSNLAIRVLNELSLIIPKDVWLINFSVDEKRKVEIEGFAKKTSDLVTAIEKSSLFSDISFSSPIISKEGDERFSLKLEVAEQ